METAHLTVEGMSCGHCVQTIEKTLSKLGVASVQVSLEKKSVDVKYDQAKLTLDAIKEAIEDQGYDVA
jgi:copper chaperone